MKDLIVNTPPSVLFLAGFASVVALGLWRLNAVLQGVIQ